MKNMQDLLEIMSQLRNPESGCPWDIKQDFSSIAPYTIEEAYEVADAIARNDMEDLKDELGDLLLQVIFHAQMAKESNLFDYSDVVDTLSEKLIRRHPHVFDSLEVRDDRELHENWEQEKKREREKKTNSQSASILDGVTLGLPALMRAQKLQKKAARVGFDWPNEKPVYDKIKEEIVEVQQASEWKNKEAVEEEIGDLLFAVVNLARHLAIDSEQALRNANNKFCRRFRGVERNAGNLGKQVRDMTLEELEQLWELQKQS